MKSVLALFISLLAGNAFGHGNHPKPIATCVATCTQVEVETAVSMAVSMLVTKGKVPASWNNAKVEKVEKKEFKKGPEWVATLFDQNEKDLTRQRLYVFITTDGFLNGSNFTGN